MSDYQPTFPDHYCPYCLSKTDLKGDHWDGGCEYESRFGDWINPLQPLTRSEMLNRKLIETEEEISRLQKFRCDVISQLAAIKTDL